MPGLIDAVPQQAQQPQPPQQPQSQPQSAPSPEQTKEKTFQVQKIVLAAQKVMYSEQTGKEFLKELQGDDVVQMAAKAATSVMMILIAESKLQINPELVIPAGVIVVGDILDFIEQAKGIHHTEDQVESAIELFVKQMVAAVSPDQPSQSAQQPEPAAQPQQEVMQ